MSHSHRIVFFLGGPDFHPVLDQAQAIAGWLGSGYKSTFCFGRDAFEHLEACDLFVVMGLHWTGMGDDYEALNESDKRAFESYVASGRPLLIHHGAIASYDDWPRFGELLGFTWIWGSTNHSPVDMYRVEVAEPHPVVHGISSFEICDELYYDIAVTQGMSIREHAYAYWEGKQLPMVMTVNGGRIDGAGKAVYLANGHDMRAFEAPALKQLWVNAVHWLLEDQKIG
jgi:hypothetical protein